MVILSLIHIVLIFDFVILVFYAAVVIYDPVDVLNALATSVVIQFVFVFHLLFDFGRRPRNKK